MNLHQTLAGCAAAPPDLKEQAKASLQPHVKSSIGAMTAFHSAALMSYDVRLRSAYVTKYGPERCRLFDQIVNEALGLIKDRSNNQLGTIIQNACSIF